MRNADRHNPVCQRSPQKAAALQPLRELGQLAPIATSSRSTPQNTLGSNLPALIKAAGNPNLPAEYRTMANTMLGGGPGEHCADRGDEGNTASMLTRECRAGRVPADFTEWSRGNKAAVKTDITIDNRAKNEEAKALGKAAGERAGEMYKSSNAAGKGLTNLAKTEALLGHVEQGKIQPAVQNFQHGLAPSVSITTLRSQLD